MPELSQEDIDELIKSGSPPPSTTYREDILLVPNAVLENDLAKINGVLKDVAELKGDDAQELPRRVPLVLKDKGSGKDAWTALQTLRKALPDVAKLITLEFLVHVNERKYVPAGPPSSNGGGSAEDGSAIAEQPSSSAVSSSANGGTSLVPDAEVAAEVAAPPPPQPTGGAYTISTPPK